MDSELLLTLIIFTLLVCTDCLTKKPIDFSSLPKEFMGVLTSNETQNKLNERFSTTTNVIKICDFCYLGK